MPANLYELTDTWDNGATVFVGIGLDVTDTASGATSRLISMTVGGVDKFAVDKNGAITVCKSATVSTGTITTSQPAFNATQTWNAGGVVFTGIYFNATDTASANGSFLLNLATGGTVRFYVSKTSATSYNVCLPPYGGNFISGAGNTSSSALTTNGVEIGSNSTVGYLGWTTGGSAGSNSTIGTALWQDGGAAGNLALRNGTSAQTFRIYETYTDASNYGRLGISYSGGSWTIAPQWAGTGSSRNLIIGTTTSGSNTTINATDTVTIGAHLAVNTFFLYRGGTIGPSNFDSVAFATSNGPTSVWATVGGKGVNFVSNAGIHWGGTAYGNNVSGVTPDTRLIRGAASGIISIDNNSTGGGFVKLNPTTVASLPAAATAGFGTMGFVSDATSTTVGSTVAGGGSNKVKVWTDGTNWIIG